MTALPVFDPRLTPARADLAAKFLQGRIAAERYSEGIPAHISVSSCALRRHPAQTAPMDTEAVFGEAVVVYEQKNGWAWVQLLTDHYVGYVPAHALREGPPPRPTHYVKTLRSFAYPEANIKTPPQHFLSLGTSVHVDDMRGAFAKLSDGLFLYASHLMPIDNPMSDPVDIAESLIGVPYFWGGKTSLGLDCSGLVQLSYQLCGLNVPRDSDLQEKTIGRSVAIEGELPCLLRGDLLFWKGHVGLMQDQSNLLHANGHHMLVSSEPVAQAISRIEAAGGGNVTAIRRSHPM